jgi:hypothetical protein
MFTTVGRISYSVFSLIVIASVKKVCSGLNIDIRRSILDNWSEFVTKSSHGPDHIDWLLNRFNSRYPPHF